MSDPKRQKTSSSSAEFVSVKLGQGGLLEASGTAGPNEVTMELSGMSAESKTRADELVKQLEAKRRARSMAVPTNDYDVKRRLRQLGEPITYFGEGPANRRERLRGLLAQIAVDAASGIENDKVLRFAEIVKEGDGDLDLSLSDARVHKKAYDTDGSAALLNSRVEMFQFSIPRARKRLLAAKRRRANMTKEIMANLDKEYADRAVSLRSFVNTTSQIGCGRPISSCSFSSDSSRLATASWSGIGKIWSVPDSALLCTLRGHEDRISDIRYHPHARVTVGQELSVATAGVDGALCLWSLNDIEKNAAKKMDTGDDMKVETVDGADAGVKKEKSGKEEQNNDEEEKVPHVKPLAKLQGHEDRLSRIEFHPSGNYIASTSYDATWRLWDLTLQQELLCQDGHAVGVYGLAFQGDGSLMATGDIGGVCHVWDLRTGKSIATLDGHVDNILSMDFSPNGHTLATGSCDNSVRIWDLRKRRCIYTILAHSKLISNVRYHPNNEDFLLTSSYDQTVKIWSARDYQLIKSLRGHEDRVMRVEMSPDGKMLSSTSFDRTWKLWMADEA